MRTRLGTSKTLRWSDESFRQRSDTRRSPSDASNGLTCDRFRRQCTAQNKSCTRLSFELCTRLNFEVHPARMSEDGGPSPVIASLCWMPSRIALVFRDSNFIKQFRRSSRGSGRTSPFRRPKIKICDPIGQRPIRKEKETIGGNCFEPCTEIVLAGWTYRAASWHGRAVEWPACVVRRPLRADLNLAPPAAATIVSSHTLRSRQVLRQRPRGLICRHGSISTNAISGATALSTGSARLS